MRPQLWTRLCPDAMSNSKSKVGEKMTSEDRKRALRHLGNCIRDKRIETGLSQTELSALLEISQPTLSRIEAGERDFEVLVLFRLSQVFGTRLTEWAEGLRLTRQPET